jgi:hypothetical protein
MNGLAVGKHTVDRHTIYTDRKAQSHAEHAARQVQRQACWKAVLMLLSALLHHRHCRCLPPLEGARVCTTCRAMAICWTLRPPKLLDDRSHRKRPEASF